MRYLNLALRSRRARRARFVLAATLGSPRYISDSDLPPTLAVLAEGRHCCPMCLPSKRY